MVVGGRELIDTLWNVNTDDSVAIKANKTELIDTLWNVNIVGNPTVTVTSGINRYIMECKF